MKADAVLGEAKIITALFLLILRKDHVPHEQDILFANLRFFVPGILDTKPDLFDGSSAVDLKSHIRQSLDRMVVPSKHGGILVVLASRS